MKVLTTSQTARYMGRHPNTIRKLAKAYEHPNLYPGVKGLRFHRLNDRGHYRFLVADVDRYLGL